MIAADTKRNEIAGFMRRLYERGLTTSSGGNISCRISDDCILITASRTDKGDMHAEDVGIVTIAGKNLTPHLVSSIETAMHLAVYRLNPAVSAVIHAHPVHASAFTASGADLRTDLLSESYAFLGTPVEAPYALMGSEELAQNVAQASTKGCCILMRNHGVMTVGSTLFEAYDRIEVLENAARTSLITTALGSAKPLNQKQRAAIDILLKR